ncbi:MAG TPA: BTAD domain-containing putative transcriptional regulator [Dongiaceae bacterium]|nr:BTAD domain-containing putative transcriptional regulator [Dongiaceae bacterium]
MIDRAVRLDQLLHDAILLADGPRDDAVARHLRSARLSLHEMQRSQDLVVVDVLSGRVFSNGLPVPLARTELALMFALALHGPAGAPREVLAEDLYPGHPLEGALPALKVIVHRVRRRIGCHSVIRHAHRRLALGERVQLELPEIEKDVHAALVSPALDDLQRERFSRLRHRMLDGRPTFLLEWPWFDDCETRVRDLSEQISVVLARDALRREAYQEAVDYASDLTRSDPLNESAAEIAIRALLLAGDRIAAILEYRRYASVLRREVDSRPPQSLRELVDGPAP